jgi:hypothetical protein
LQITRFAKTSLNVMWAASNHSGYFNRASATGIVQPVGSKSALLLTEQYLISNQDFAGAAMVFIFTAQSAPRYFGELYFAVGMTFMSIILSAIMVRQ